jgi:exonuclease SbcD
MIRLLHTSDWHLGHTLHDLPRRHEHAEFLSWLLDRLDDEQVDALIVAGDIFDAANPSADAQQTLYKFLAEARVRRQHLDIIFIGGNHDSAARLDAPDPLLRAFNIRIVGGLPHAGERVDNDSVIIPVRGRDREIGVWVAAVPFLRAFDLPSVVGDDPLVNGVRQVYAQVFAALRARREPGQALVAVGHCYMVGTQLSELSERKILGGNQHALPVDIFPEDIAYVALGHLHRAQCIGGREHIRYSGSPIPLSMAEAPYTHEVRIVELEGERLVSTRSLPIPRVVPFLKIPADRPRPLDQVLALLAALPAASADALDPTRPYLEVDVVLTKPEPSLRESIEKAVVGKAARLVRIGVTLEGSGVSLADAFTTQRLSELLPEQVFRQCYRRTYPHDPTDEMLASFSDLLDRVRAEAP